MTTITFSRVGVQGTQGEQGRVGIPFTYSTTTTQADPGAGALRLNNAALASVTAAVLDATSAASGNPDVSDAIAAYGAGTSTIKARLRIAKASQPDEVWAEYDITGITDNGTHLSLALTYVDHAGTFTDAMATYLNFSRTGDKGEAGAVATPSETLAALLTVDGTGSGLDADLLDGNHASAFAAASHTHLVADLSDASANGRSFLQAANYAAMVGLLGLTIGVNTQAYSANLTTWAGLAPSANGQSLVTAADYSAMRALLDLEAGTDFYSISAVNSAFQPLDSDLTAIAALTTNAAGRSVLTLADPNADRIAFWDDSAGAFEWLTLGTGLSITGTTINAAAVGGSDTQVQFNDGGVLSGDAGLTYNKTTDVLTIASGGGLAFSTDLTLGRAAAAKIRMGAADAASPVAQTLSVQNVVAGTSNTAGANFTIAGSQGTGTGAGGDIVFQIAPAGSTGSAVNALATAMTIAGNFQTTIGKSNDYQLLVSPNAVGSQISIVGFNSTKVKYTQSGVTQLVLASDISLGWGAATNVSAMNGDLLLFRDAANTLALRNATAAQAFNIYNTYTDGSNYERLNIAWASNIAVIEAAAAGTGTVRSIGIKTTGLIAMGLTSSSASLVLGSTSNTNAALQIKFSVTGNDGSGGSTAGYFGRISSNFGIFDGSGSAIFTFGSTGGVHALTGSMQLVEQTAPSAPSTNNVRIYAEDNGAGKTRIMALFATGAAQQIAIEP